MAGCRGLPAEFDRSWVNHSPSEAGSFPSQHWPPATGSSDLQHSQLGFSCRERKRELLDNFYNLMIMTKCVIPCVSQSRDGTSIRECHHLCGKYVPCIL